jgi:hypothetical protein
MATKAPTIVFGPAYLDVVLTLDRPLFTDSSAGLLDRSIAVTAAHPLPTRTLELVAPDGARLTIALPSGKGTEYTLDEPLAPGLITAATATSVVKQLGGMGAGYALALGGILRCPLGDDAVGRKVRTLLDAAGIQSQPITITDCPADISQVLISPAGDKLATGLRTAMARWEHTPEDTKLIRTAAAVVCCGPRNALIYELLTPMPMVPVMLAAALRNVTDTEVPLAAFADRIAYLSLNAMEWEHLPGRSRVRAAVPVITITDGAKGSRVLLRGGGELHIPAVPFRGTPDSNHAGETYGAAMFAALQRAAPGFHRSGRVPRAAAETAAYRASDLAGKQLAIHTFGFPPGI